MNLAPWSSVLNNTVAGLTVVVAILGLVALLARSQLTRQKDEAFATTIAATNERAARLELEAAAQRQRAADAERQLLELRERIQDRVISTEQAAIFMPLGRQGSGSPILVYVLGSTGESKRLGEQFTDLLNRAGWTTSQMAGFTVPRSGIWLVVTPEWSQRVGVVALEKAIAALGFEFHLDIDPDADSKQPTLKIWDK